MKNKSTLIVLGCLLITSSFVTAGCNDETVPDPKIVEARDKQRQQMRPGGNTTPATAPGTGN
ncbi:hypothetical protein MCEMSE15_01827 [Fimbriimonadaceae bacterium]